MTEVVAEVEDVAEVMIVGIVTETETERILLNTMINLMVQSDLLELLPSMSLISCLTSRVCLELPHVHVHRSRQGHLKHRSPGQPEVGLLPTMLKTFLVYLVSWFCYLEFSKTMNIRCETCYSCSNTSEAQENDS